MLLPADRRHEPELGYLKHTSGGGGGVMEAACVVSRKASAFIMQFKYLINICNIV